MKRIFKSLLIAFISLFASISTVLAAGSVNVTLSPNSTTITKGGNVVVTIKVSNITGANNDQVAGAGGFINFDSEYLQFVSYANSNNWSGSAQSKGTGKYKYITYDMGSGAVGNGSAVGVFTFKTLKSGSTTISMTEPDFSDNRSTELVATVSNATITITDPAPALDSDSKLKSLSVEGFSLSPSFNANTKAYTVSVPEGTTSVNISAAANSTKAKSVTGTGVQNLTGDTSTFTVKCTAENNSSTSYTITVNRAKHVEPTPDPEPEPTKSNDASLKALDVSGYSLSPGFNPDTTSYSMNVGSGVSGLQVTAIPNSDKATLLIEGNNNWSYGRNKIYITVTAEEGTKKTYEVNVNRESPKVKSSDKNVDFRIISSHTIEPQFSNDINDYNVTVPYDVKSLDLSVVPYDKNASVSISGNDKLTTDGINVVTIKVTAEDGSSKTIKLNVTRTEYKANTDLLDLKVKGYEIDPAFKPSKTNYKVTIPYKVTKVKVLVKAPKGAKYEITGYKNLQIGKNTVLVKVTDEKDFVKYYQVIVTRKGPFTIFGLRLIPFLIILFLFLLFLLLLLLLLLRRKKKKEEPKEEVKEEPVEQKKDESVHIDFKPEFNFNSKNGTDDDTIYSNGPMISGVDPKKLIENQETIVDAKYDIYDDVVTKDELVDALNEGIKTKNVDKLQMLLDQENLNRKKSRMKKKEAESNDDYEPAHSSDDYDEE